MVLISAGEFMMGCNPEASKTCTPDQLPYHRIGLAAYHMDRTEVTVSQYGGCVRAGACTPPLAGGDHDGCNWGDESRADHPVNCVSWEQARVFCQWAHKRLPTEAEWEKAARGVKGRKYPWGKKKPNCSLAVMDRRSAGKGRRGEPPFSGCGRNSTWPVCSRKQGNGPYGLCDMAGNVYEWVADWYWAEQYHDTLPENPPGPSRGTYRVLRGGSWTDFRTSSLRSYFRSFNSPESAMLNHGIRCAVDAE